MKRLQIWAAILAVSIGPAAWGGVFTEGAWSSGFANGGNIPDGSTAGWSDTRNVSDITMPSASIVGVTVTFTISGGFNGDLYAYLSHDGVLVPLLNRVGTGTGPNTSPTYYFGYSDAGFNNVTLADGGAGGSIHNYGSGGAGVPTGTYSPDSGGLTFAGAYGGINPDGNWTLFFADLSAGGGQSELVNWSLSINAVPEPVNVALGIFGGIVLIVIVARTRPVRIWAHRRRGGFNQWLDAV